MTDYERVGEYQPSDRSVAGTAITFLLIGLGVGALAALLFAPKSGRQLRKVLRRKYEDTVENLTEHADEWAERGSDWAATAKEKVAPIARAARRI
ncbi:MAG TPA: YtxH domain-containing protein [Terriglobales bacterium]|jgi:gas vesicle protein|nr:YtxH domain-containing protein [Terriglobales bacterium]